MVEGKQDPGASRRVVLGHEFNRDRLIADLGDAGRMETGSGPARNLVWSRAHAALGMAAEAEARRRYPLREPAASDARLFKNRTFN